MKIYEEYDSDPSPEEVVSAAWLGKLTRADALFPEPELYIGIELELEDWEKNYGGLNEYRAYWTEVEDGSLRNFGTELVSRPIPITYAPDLLLSTFQHFKVSEKNYSERTSVHVHVNMKDMEQESVLSLIMLYQLYERGLFNFVGGNRADNIFCVPWSECGFADKTGERIIQYVDSVSRGWMKYTALNLQPLRSKNTVEFRHMLGTSDIQKLTNWLRLIAQLVAYARKLPPQELQQRIINLNSSSEYERFTAEVFQGVAWLLMSQPTFTKNLVEGVIEAKLLLGSPKVLSMKSAQRKHFDPSVMPEAFHKGLLPDTWGTEGLTTVEGSHLDPNIITKLIDAGINPWTYRVVNLHPHERIYWNQKQIPKPNMEGMRDQVRLFRSSVPKKKATTKKAAMDTPRAAENVPAQRAENVGIIVEDDVVNVIDRFIAQDQRLRAEQGIRAAGQNRVGPPQEFQWQEIAAQRPFFGDNLRWDDVFPVDPNQI